MKAGILSTPAGPAVANARTKLRKKRARRRVFTPKAKARKNAPFAVTRQSTLLSTQERTKKHKKGFFYKKPFIFTKKKPVQPLKARKNQGNCLYPLDERVKKCYYCIMDNSNELNQKIAKNLSFYRKAAGLTQAELALKIN